MAEKKSYKRNHEEKTELLKEDMPNSVPRFRTREDDFVENRFPKQTVELIVLAALVITSIVCGIKVLGITAAVICVIVFIELLMGFFLGNSPSFISVILVLAMILVGVFTGTLETILVGAVVFLTTILVVKDKAK